MKASEILSYISKTELEKLAIEYKVDHQSKKLEGVIMFQLLLISIVSEKRNSLRVMEEFYSSILFQKKSEQANREIFIFPENKEIEYFKDTKKKVIELFYEFRICKIILKKEEEKLLFLF